LGDIKSRSTRCDAVDSEWPKLTFDPKSDEICGWTRHQFASQAPGVGC
jgi:hypothetical protein